jgi:quinolinate synthase
MATEVLFLAEQVGSQYRGLVVDAKTHRAILITAHNYINKTIAECAARRAYSDAAAQALANQAQELGMGY